MTGYQSANVNISNSQLDKLKSATKNKAEVALRLSPNIVVETNDETNWLMTRIIIIIVVVAVTIIPFISQQNELGFLKSYLQIDYLHPKIHKVITGKIQRNLK